MDGRAGAGIASSRRSGLAGWFARQRTGLALALGLGAAYAWFYQGGGWNQNSRFALVRALVEQGTLRIDHTVRFRGRLVTRDFAEHDGHAYSDKAPGLALAAVPVVALARPLVAEPGSRAGIAALSYLATVATAGLTTVLAALLILKLAPQLGASRGGAGFAALCFGLGTPAWAYATLFFGHALATACLLAAFAAALALRRAGGTGRDWRLALAVGLAGGWATLTEYPSVVPAAIAALLAVAQAAPGGAARRARVLAGVVAGALACAAVLAAHNHAAFGSALALGYSHEAWVPGMRQGLLGVTYPRPWVLWELLFGRYRGLLYLAPVLVAAPVGLGLLLRNPPTRTAALAASAIAVYYLLFNAAYFYWDGGWIYGPRHLAPALPFACLALAPLWSRADRLGRAALGALALYGAGLTLVAVSTTAQPPEGFKRPVSELLLPSFVRGELSLNQQGFVDAEVSDRRDPVAHAWNLGERLGLEGRASLAPLFAAWALVALGWWWLGRRAPAD